MNTIIHGSVVANTDTIEIIHRKLDVMSTKKKRRERLKEMNRIGMINLFDGPFVLINGEPNEFPIRMANY